MFLNICQCIIRLLYNGEFFAAEPKPRGNLYTTTTTNSKTNIRSGRPQKTTANASSASAKRKRSVSPSAYKNEATLTKDRPAAAGRSRRGSGLNGRSNALRPAGFGAAAPTSKRQKRGSGFCPFSATCVQVALLAISTNAL